MKNKGAKAEMWVDGNKISPEGDDTPRENDGQKTFQTFSFTEPLGDPAFENVYMFVPKGEASASAALTVEHDNNLWKDMLRFVGYRELRFYPDGKRWFCPWWELFTNEITPMGQSESEFEISIGLSPGDCYGPLWKNRWAPTVHWLWAHLWVPLRRLVLRFRKSEE